MLSGIIRSMLSTKNVVFLLYLVGLTLNISYAESPEIATKAIMREVDVNTILNSDSSISYEIIFGMIYNHIDGIYNDSIHITQRYRLPENAEIDKSSVKVTELLEDKDFGYSVFEFSTCNNEFTYSPETKEVTICTKIRNQSRLKVEARILPKMSIEDCRVCEKLGNNFTIILPESPVPYFVNVKSVGASDMLINESEADVCKGKYTENYSIDLKAYHINNGFQCQGEIIAPNDLIEMHMEVAGFDLNKANARKQAELEVLQKENIEASKNSSLATIALAVFTLILVGATYSTSKASKETAEIMKRDFEESKMPYIDVALEPFEKEMDEFGTIEAEFTEIGNLRITNVSKTNIAKNVYIEPFFTYKGEETPLSQKIITSLLPEKSHYIPIREQIRVELEKRRLIATTDKTDDNNVAYMVIDGVPENFEFSIKVRGRYQSVTGKEYNGLNAQYMFFWDKGKKNVVKIRDTNVV